MDVDDAFRIYLETILAAADDSDHDSTEHYGFMSISRVLERIGDNCSNVTEDAVFLVTGEVVRHAYQPKE